MTRSNAREIALGCIFECLNARKAPEDVLDYRLKEPGLTDLMGEYEVFSQELTEKDEAYIRDVVTAAVVNTAKYATSVAALSDGWSGARIARITKAILILALAEIDFQKDVPASVAVNEAVELAKKYDTEKAPGFINGILGNYLRARDNGQAPTAVTEG